MQAALDLLTSPKGHISQPDFSFESDYIPSQPMSLNTMIDRMHPECDLDYTVSTPVSDNSNTDNIALHSQIRIDLNGLPKETYVTELIRMCENSDLLVKGYRMSLLYRARLIEKCPKTKLFNRKNTKNTTSVKRFALDCYILEQFIQGDETCEIEEIFSTHPVPSQKSLSNIHHTPNKSSLNSENDLYRRELRLLKETVAGLSAEIGVLRDGVKSKDEQNRKMNDEMSKTIGSLKTESDACNEIVCDFFQRYYPDMCVAGDLASKLKLIFSKVNTTELKQNHLTRKAEEISINLKNIASNIEGINDTIEADKRKSKTNVNINSEQLTCLEEKVGSMDEKLKSTYDSTNNTKTTLKSLDRRINEFEAVFERKLMAKLERFSNKMLETQTVIQSDFMGEVTRKIDSLNRPPMQSTVTESNKKVQKKTSYANVTNGSDPSSMPLDLTTHSHEEHSNAVPNPWSLNPRSDKAAIDTMLRSIPPPNILHNDAQITDKQPYHNVITEKENIRRNSDYFVGRLKETDTAEAIIEHLNVSNVEHRFVSVLISNNSGMKYARIGAYYDTKDTFDQVGFWPPYVQYRVWKKNPNNNQQQQHTFWRSKS